MKTIKPDPLTRRQLFPLLGGAVALATVAPRSTIADSSNPVGRPPAAKARFVYVGTYTFPGTAPGGTQEPGDGDLCVQDEPEQWWIDAASNRRDFEPVIPRPRSVSAPPVLSQ
jgi:hypothetical protein